MYAENIMIPHFRVKADAKTGEWLGTPQYVGEVSLKKWVARKDTKTAHFDTYEATVGDGWTETRAIELIFVDQNR